MSKEFLGSGLKFPFKLDVRGHIALSQYEDKIKESMAIILGTAKGERVMLPEFGCDIHEYPFSVMNTSTFAMIKNSVKEALLLWEPRIDVLSVKTFADKMQEGILDISIDYKIRSTNTEFNLVYPFYMKSGE